MKSKGIRNRNPIIGLMVLCALLLIQCSGATGSTDDAADDGNSSSLGSDTLAADASANAVVDSVADSLGSFTSGFSGSMAVKKSETDDGNDYSCEYDEAANSVTCACPGGGTMTHTFDGVSVLGDDGVVRFDDNVTTVFNDCVELGCNEEVTLDGTVSGHFEGYYDYLTDERSLTYSMGTAGTCSGLSINEAEIGFNFTVIFEGETESLSGTFCAAENGEVITFDSYEELMEQFDADNECEAKDGHDWEDEDASEDEESDEDDGTWDDEEWDDEEGDEESEDDMMSE